MKLKERLLPDDDESLSYREPGINDNEEMDENGYSVSIFYNNTDSSPTTNENSNKANSDSDSGDEEAYQLLSIPHTLLRKDRLIDINPEDKSLEEEDDDDDDDDYDRDNREVEMRKIRMNKMSDIVKNSGDFKALPDEVVLRIFKYLDSDSLGRISCTCKRFHDLSYDVDIWEHVSKKETWGKMFNGSSRSDFIDRKRGFMGRVNSKKRSFSEELHAAKQELRERNSIFCLHLLGMNKVNETVCILILIAFTALVCTKLDHKHDIPWSCVLIPLYILIVFIFGPIIIYMLLSWYSHKSLDYEIISTSSSSCEQLYLGFLAFYWLSLEDVKDLLHLLSWVTAWVVGLVLLSLKLNGVEIHWAIVSIPFHIIFFIMEFTILRDSSLCNDNACFEVFYFIPVFVSISAFLIMLTIQLETDVYWSWNIVFIPLYIVDFLAFFYLLAPTLSLFCNCHFDEFLREDPAIVLIVGGIFDFFTIIPVFIFKILLGLTLDGIKDYTFSSMFSTVFIMEVFGLLMFFIYMVEFI